MPMSMEQVRSAALQLDRAEREALAEELLLSLVDDAEQAEIDRAVVAEAERRTALYESGQTGATPVDEAIERILRKHRP